MTNLAKKALSENPKPKFDTVRKVIESFGLKLVAEPIEKNSRP
jgi:DNA-binding phage protein